ncbi:hypothetical protein [Thiomicrorhabdus sp.]|uniref:hypothetical protein n=1 Tax=Thiomicrorhabdus sp. TaxID=2039724 RepID=UPI002AA8875C|nr:hypothetical protein [Thiomicrorhabdus sp.]
MLNYLHIGMPKNLSSTLQEYYFSKHQDIYHLGVGNGSLIDYIDDDINVLFENYLLYSRDYEYSISEQKFRGIIKKHKDKATKNGSVAFGASLELLSFTFTPDMIDITTKARRLRLLFGDDTKILMVIRNQADLIKSMYREFIKIGYPGTYREYIDYLFLYKSRSFFYDFSYKNLYQVFAQEFGSKNIEIIIAEEIRDETGALCTKDGYPELLSKLDSILKVKPRIKDLGHSNAPLTSSELYHKQHLNKKYPHDLGGSMFEFADNHRLNKYFSKFRHVQVADSFFDIRIKRLLTTKAQQLAKLNPVKISYDADLVYLKEMKIFYESENADFSKMVGLDLPKQYYNLEL